MSKIVTRILLFVTVVPLLILFIFFLPQFNHLAINIVIIGSSIIGAFETANFFAARGLPIHKRIVPFLGGALPALTFLEIAGVLEKDWLLPAFILLCMIVFVLQIFRKDADDFKNTLPAIGSSITVIVYPGLFLSYFVRFTEFGYAENVVSFLLAFFFLLVFLNDSAAYLFGMLFGKGSRQMIPVSPNKSLIGFIGGFIVSIGLALTAYFLFPQYMGDNIVIPIVLGIGVGILTIIGDLAESAMKRSADIKDSGSIIPGRGGIMDSIDSLIFSAPFFYFVIKYVAGTM